MAQDPLNDRFQITPVMTLLAVFTLIALILAYLRHGHTEIETGSVVSFGSYADETGNQPLVVVGMRDGRQEQVFAAPNALNGCKVGSPIVLQKQGGTLRAAPFACLDKPKS